MPRSGRMPLSNIASTILRDVFDGLNAFWNFPYFSAAEVLNALMP